eukprot:gene16981-20763_t
MVAAAEAQLAPAQANAMLSACAMCIGIATILQCARSRLGSGYLAVHVPSPGALPLAIQALALGGIGLMAATTLLVGISQLFVARLVRPLRVVLPPEVCGVAVTMLGVSLAEPALRRAMGLSEHSTAIASASLMVSLLTLGLIVSVTIFAPRRLKLFAVFIGASAGWALAVALGVHRPETAEVLAAAPWIALPQVHLP